MQRVGEKARLKVVGQPENGRVRVLDVDTGREGVLLLKNKLKCDADGLVRNAWVLQHSLKRSETVYGNSFFGRWDIRPALQSEYLRIIDALYKNPVVIKPEDMSTLKGMCNRCLRKDQWDWYTTYSFLGSPETLILRQFVGDAVRIRDVLREGKRDGLEVFCERYRALLESMRFFLKRLRNVDEIDTSIPPFSLPQTFWGELTEDSRRNIVIIEHCMDATSQFVLMHYFVTLETEFRQKLIAPFQKAHGDRLRKLRSFDMAERQTHDILVGRTEMTIGSIEFLGRYISRPDNLIYSESIRQYKAFLGDKVPDVVKLCADIGNAKICNVYLRDLRNRLAHGDAAMLKGSKAIDLACSQLRDFLLSPDNGVLERIVAIGTQHQEKEEAVGLHEKGGK